MQLIELLEISYSQLENEPLSSYKWRDDEVQNFLRQVAYVWPKLKNNRKD
jgi:hypothetical protein